LLGASAAQVGFITTAGWLGILTTLPIVTVCPWHRTLLALGGLLNVGAPILRYYAAARYAPGVPGVVPGVPGAYDLVALSNALQGAAFGVLGAWPPMLAAMQWPARRQALVIALASLSNYVGGALGTVAMPAIAGSAEQLLGVFERQAYAAALLGAAMLSWLWLPPFHGGSGGGGGGGGGEEASEGATAHAADAADGGASTEPKPRIAGGGQPHAATAATAAALAPAPATTQASAGRVQLRRDLLLCTRGRPGAVVGLFGLVIGVSTLLQGVVQELLSGVGFSDEEAGAGNCLYQMAGALVGVGLSSRVTDLAGARRTVRAMHGALAAAYACLALLCWAVWAASGGGPGGAAGRGTSSSSAAFRGAVPLLVAASLALGGSLMGILPFCLQVAVHECAPASENVISGLIYIVAMSVSAAFTQLSASVAPLSTVAVVAGLLLAELAGFRRLLATEGATGGGGGDQYHALHEDRR
jgi:hypothetical protein